MKLVATSLQRLLKTALLCGYALAVHAQSSTLSVGGGVNPLALRDRAYSPLVYSGVGGEGQLAYRVSAEHKESVWLASAGGANLSNVHDRNLSTFAIRLTHLTFYTPADSTARFTWGWANNNGFHRRFIDDFQNFNGRVDFFTTFGPAAKYAVPFTFKSRQFVFDAAAHVQLIGVYLPSGYVASLPSGFGYERKSFVGAVAESMQIFHPGSSYNAVFWPRLQWQLNTCNALSINYLYEYTSFAHPHRSVRSSGHWFITFSTALQ